MALEDPPRDPVPAEVPATGATTAEAEAWAEVVRAWADEDAHRRYLARFQTLESLATPGGRYKAVLAERPGDAMAEKMRAEILKKATAYGLAALPRTPPEPSRNVRRLRMALAAAAGGLLVYGLYQIIVLLAGARS